MARQLDLFDEGFNIENERFVTLDDLLNVKDDSFSWIKNNSQKINLKAKGVIDFFVRENSLKPSDCPQYYCSPYWGDATGNYKWRYMIIRHENVNYLVFLRIVGIMFNQQYFSITYRILPSAANNNISLVFDALRHIDSIKTVESIYDGDFETCENVNFYCDQEMLSVDNPRMKYKKNKVEWLVENGLVVKQISEKYLMSFYGETMQLYDIFQESHFKFDTKSANKHLFTLVGRNGCYVYGYYFKNKIVGVQMVCNDFANCCSKHFAKDITPLSVSEIAAYVGCTEKEAKDVKRFLGVYEEEFIKKEIVVNKHYDALFNDGFHKKNPQAMIEHKKDYYRKVVYYKVEKI